jgi:hypothetical protein
MMLNLSLQRTASPPVELSRSAAPSLSENRVKE